MHHDTVVHRELIDRTMCARLFEVFDTSLLTRMIVVSSAGGVSSRVLRTLRCPRWAVVSTSEAVTGWTGRGDVEYRRSVEYGSG